MKHIKQSKVVASKNPEVEEQSNLLTVKEASDICRIPLPTVYFLLNNRKFFTSTKIGGRWRIYKNRLDASLLPDDSKYVCLLLVSKEHEEEVTKKVKPLLENTGFRLQVSDEYTSLCKSTDLVIADDRFLEGIRKKISDFVRLKSVPACVITSSHDTAMNNGNTFMIEKLENSPILKVIASVLDK